MTIVPLALATVLLAPAGRAQDFLKKDAPVPKVEAKAVSVGRVAPKDFQKTALGLALKGIEANADKIALFVNDNGCRVAGGKKTALTGAALLELAKQLASKVEVVLLSADEMKATFSSKGKVPWAIGMCGEGRAAGGYPLPGKKDADVIILRTEDGKPVPVEKLKENLPDNTLSHEFLHVLLNQLGNARLGGGDAKPACVVDGKVANVHHRLTRHLYWGQFGGEWTPPETAPACD